ncbi:zinc ribbon domain-containing protein [Candidatus Pacearchaeota archaeon]|nr:zinc ribbon domain-containing protein [Candidatus Pacearchaeota archaeon]
MDANSLQKRMNEIQSDASFASALGKLMSGRPGYKPVIETKQVIIKCKNCGRIMEDGQKFCHECGTKVELPQKH